MSLLDQVAPSPRKIMTLFYVVDTSGSMTGEKIGSVNSAMEEAITIDLPDISAANDDAEIRRVIHWDGIRCNNFQMKNGGVCCLIIFDVIFLNEVKPEGKVAFKQFEFVHQ